MKTGTFTLRYFDNLTYIVLNLYSFSVAFKAALTYPRHTNPIRVKKKKESQVYLIFLKQARNIN